MRKQTDDRLLALVRVPTDQGAIPRGRYTWLYEDTSITVILREPSEWGDVTDLCRARIEAEGRIPGMLILPDTDGWLDAEGEANG